MGGVRGGASGPMVGRDRELARVMLLLDDAGFTLLRHRILLG